MKFKTLIWLQEIGNSELEFTYEIQKVLMPLKNTNLILSIF
jgi:hypothetical protein